MSLDFTSFDSNLYFGGAQSATGTNGALRPQAFTFQDGMSSLSGLLTQDLYTQDIYNPSLPTPIDDASSKPRDIWSGTPSPSNAPLADAFYTSFAEHLQQLIEGPPYLTEAQADTLIFAEMTGEPIPDDTFLNDLLTGLEDKVGTELVQTFGEDAFPSIANQARALKGGGDSIIGTTRTELQKLQNYIKTLPEGPEKAKLQQFLDQANASLSDIGKTLDKLQYAADRQQFSQLLSQLQDQTESFSEQMSLAGELSNDPNIASAFSIAAQTIGRGIEVFSDNISVADQNNQLAQGNWSLFTSEAGKIFQGVIRNTFEVAFENTLSKYAEEHGLSNEEVAELKYAHFNPNASGIRPEIKTMLGEINSRAIGSLSPGWGITSGYLPTADNTRFNAEVELAYDDSFTQVLQGSDLKTLAEALGMSEEDVKGMLEYLHNNPDQVLRMQGDPALLKKMLGITSQDAFAKIQEMLSSIEGDAFREIASTFGIPAGTQIGPSNYNAKITGRFLMQFDKNLRTQTPPLSQAQIQAVKAALADPLNPSVTAETKTLIQSIFSQTASQIRAEFHLPVGWSPQAGALPAINNMAPTLRMATSGVEQVEEGLHILAKHVSQMEDGPNKLTMINVLKLITDVVSKLKERVAELMTLDSQIAQRLSKSQMEKSLNKVDIQMQKIKDMQAKKAKLAPLMALSKIFGPVFKVIMAIGMLLACMAMGPMGMAIGVMMFTATCQDIASGGKHNFMSDMFQKIMENLPSPANIIVSCILVIALTAAAGGGGIMVFQDLFFEKSHIIQQTVKSCGGDEMAQEITNMVVQVVSDIVVAIVGSIFTGGGAAAAMAAKIAMKVAQVLIKILTKLIEMLEKSCSLLQKLARVLQKVLQKVIQFEAKMAAKVSNLTKATKELQTFQKMEKEALKTGDREGLQVARDGIKWAQNLQKEFLQQIRQELKATEKLMKFFETGSKVLEGLEKVDQARIAFIRADLANLIGELDAEIAELDNLIKSLRKVVDSMLQGISSLGEWMTEIGGLQSSMWHNQTETATSVANANER